MAFQAIQHYIIVTLCQPDNLNNVSYYELNLIGFLTIAKQDMESV